MIIFILFEHNAVKRTSFLIFLNLNINTMKDLKILLFYKNNSKKIRKPFRKMPERLCL